MKVLVAYASKYGSTRSIAERIAECLRVAGQQGEARPVQAIDDLGGYDAFVVGSAVFASHWMAEATAFVRRHRAVLADRPVWLFSSGPIGTMAAKHEPVEPKGIGALVRAIGPREHRVFFGAWDRAKLDGAKLGFAERQVAARGRLPGLGGHRGVGGEHRPGAAGLTDGGALSRAAHGPCRTRLDGGRQQLERRSESAVAGPDQRAGPLWPSVREERAAGTPRGRVGGLPAAPRRRSGSWVQPAKAWTCCGGRGHRTHPVDPAQAHCRQLRKLQFVPVVAGVAAGGVWSAAVAAGRYQDRARPPP